MPETLTEEKLIELCTAVPSEAGEILGDPDRLRREAGMDEEGTLLRALLVRIRTALGWDDPCEGSQPAQGSERYAFVCFVEIRNALTRGGNNFPMTGHGSSKRSCSTEY
ncbi:MAG TPA: hypothetical protein VFD58_34185 [Blastocatellia bacterium]|nr:hypothetical protein [Blastocatellia bacterium]